MVHLGGDAGERRIAAPQNKEMKLTKPGQHGASQLISGVRRLAGGNVTGRLGSAALHHAISLVAAAVVLGGCTDSLQYEEPAKPPLKTLFHSGDSLVVTLADSMHLAQLVDLSVFGPLRPGMTADMAKAAAGEPEAVETRDYVTFYRWRTAKGVVEVSQEQADDSVDPAVKVWRLRAFPSPPHASALLDRRIVAVVEPTVEFVTVNSATEGLVCSLGPGGSVVSARWRRLSEWYE